MPEDAYEVVLVDDGSTDDTAGRIERARERAGCRFTVVGSRTPAWRRSQCGDRASVGRAHRLHRRRRAGAAELRRGALALARGTPARDRARRRDRSRKLRRSAASGLEHPNYSGNYFWTTNVSVPLETVRAAGGFDESFSEYGWEDIELGLRLRAAGVAAVFNPKALVYHFKPRPRSGSVAGWFGRRARRRAPRRSSRGGIRVENVSRDRDQSAAARLASRDAPVSVCRPPRRGSAISPAIDVERSRTARRARVRGRAYFEELERSMP